VNFIVEFMTQILHRNWSVEHFRQACWLKRELLEFCRGEGLPTAGGKLDLTERVASYLETGRPANFAITVLPQRHGKMVDPLTPNTLIPEGCPCSQELRAFFEQELGAGFRFNRVIREYLWNNPGHTLGDAAQMWWNDRAQGQVRREIEPQFEYNRFVQAFHDQHPRASRAEAVEAWREERARRILAATTP